MEQLKDKHSITLERFNILSQGRKFSLNDIDWSKDFDRSKRWAPPSIISLEYLQSFKDLPLEVRLRYNHLHALAICEAFSLFEGDFLGTLLRVIQKNPPKGDLGSSFHEAIDHFLEEEEKHSELFWRMTQKAAPELYPTRKYRFAKTSFMNKSVLILLGKMPHTLLVWIWMTIFFEERTLMYAKEYVKAAHEDGGLDPLFVKAHRLHMMEEILHVRMDEALLNAMYRQQPMWKRKLAAWMMKGIIKGFTKPKRISMGIIKQLQKEFPYVPRQAFAKVIAEIPSIESNQKFQDVHFGPEATERTRLCMKQYPEFAGIWSLVNL